MIAGQEEQRAVYEEFTQIHDAVSLRDFIYKRACVHEKYYHYSTVKAVENIDKTSSIWCTKSAYLNDRCEGEGAGKDVKDCTYIASFSHELLENLEEWVLYGDQGFGARITIGKSNFRVSNLKGKSVHIIECGRPQEDVIPKDIKSVDVIYYSESHSNNPTVELYYDDIKNCSIKRGDFTKLQKEMPYAFKPAIWRYEHETRLIVVMDKPIVSKNVAIDLIDGERQKVLGPLAENIRNYTESQYAGNINRLL